MRISRIILAVLFALPVAANCEQSYRVYTEHPRLWLNARRLRLLRRERERESVRWQELVSLIRSRQALPEEPFVRALQYQVEGDQPAGKQAAAWAVKRAALATAPDAAELRDLAIVFDWCYPLLEPAERGRVVGRMARGAAAAAAQSSMRAFAAGVLAAMALADDWAGAEQYLSAAFEKKWRQQLLSQLSTGTLLDAPAERVAFLEMCHAARDNLNLELWDQAPRYFKQFPIYLLLQYYPATVTLAGQPFHQPSEPSASKSDPVAAVELSRTAELLTAAYETNSVETQFLQGWIAHDVYRLRTPRGSPYEFLWMNPYQPGLSYYNAPLHLYDEAAGRLWARSSWDDDAAWIGYFGGELQLFADGERSVVKPGEQAAPITFPQIAVVPAAGNASFKVRLTEGTDVFIVALRSGTTYWVKTADRGFATRTSHNGGILPVQVEAGIETPVELRTSDPNPPPPRPAARKKKK